MNRLFAVVALVSVIAIPAAHAQDAVDTKSVAVHYGDLNVGTRAGAEALLHRVKAAAKLACGEAPDLRDLEQRDVYKGCVNKAAADAIETVHAPMVASVVAGARTANAD